MGSSVRLAQAERYKSLRTSVKNAILTGMRFSGLLLLIVAVAAGAGIRGKTAESDLTVEANGLRIVAKGASTSTDESMRAFNWTPGTTVALLISAPKGGLIRFDHKHSTLSKFADAKGNDLLAKPGGDPPFSGNIGFSSFPKIAADGKSCAIEVNSPNVPAKGSARIELAGEISVLCATQTHEEVQKNVPLVNGSKVVIPDLELTLDNVGKPEFGDAALGLTLRSTQELDEVADVKFFKLDGTEIKSKRMGMSRMELLSTRTIEWNYNLAEKADAATIKIYRWTDAQKKKVAFSLNVEAGL